MENLREGGFWALLGREGESRHGDIATLFSRIVTNGVIVLITDNG